MESKLEGDELKKALQMADLGSDRREYLSTHDDYRGPHLSLDEIEANRAFHKEKSAVNRQYKAHESELNAWSMYGSKVNDLNRNEKLDPLMHGQSHRARLSEMVQSRGGQQYGQGYGKNTRSKPENHHPLSSQSTPGRADIPRARGRALSRGPRGRVAEAAMHSRSMSLSTTPASTRQDPALDSNNGGPVSAGRRGRGAPFRAARGHSTRPEPRTRRLVSVADLTSPTEFMKLAQAYTHPASNPPLASPSRDSANLEERASRSLSVAESISRPAPPSSSKKTQPDLHGSFPKHDLSVVSKKPSEGERSEVNSQSTKTPARLPKLPVTEETEKPHHVAQLPRKTPTAVELATRELTTTKDIPPKSAGDILLIDFTSDDEETKPSTKSLIKTESNHSTGLLDLDDLPMSTPEKATSSEKLLFGLDFCTPSPVRVSAQFVEIAAPEYERISGHLLDVNAHATGMADGLESEATKKQPPRVSTPENRYLSPQDAQITPDPKTTPANSFIDHRSPRNSSSSDASTAQGRAQFPESNLSPRKPQPAGTEPLPSFSGLKISEPPGLKFQPDEPRTASARDLPHERSVRKDVKSGGSGQLMDSIHASDQTHGLVLGGARTIGVKPSHSKKILEETTVEVERATRNPNRAASSSVSTTTTAPAPPAPPSGLMASRFATQNPASDPATQRSASGSSFRKPRYPSSSGYSRRRG